MEQSDILIFVGFLAAGAIALVVTLSYLRRRSAEDSPKLAIPEKAQARFKSDDPSTRSPTGSMAARREDIEDLLRGKEEATGP